MMESTQFRNFLPETEAFAAEGLQDSKADFPWRVRHLFDLAQVALLLLDVLQMRGDFLI